MVWLPGSNNGEWGLNMSRGSMFPANMGGPLGFKGFPLPQLIQHPAPTMDKPYQGSAFGRRFGTVYQLTPGGVTTENGWGFNNKVRNFGIRRRRRSRSVKKRRCKGVKENGKRC